MLDKLSAPVFACSVCPHGPDIEVFVGLVITHLQSSDKAAVRSTVTCIMTLLRAEQARASFAQAGGVNM